MREMSMEEGTQIERPFQAIAAMSLNRVIGKENKIPWHIPEDFKWFKDKTLGHIVVMGRKTFEGMGHPLPNRRHLVLTRRPQSLVDKHPGLFGEFREWHGGEKFRERNLLLLSSIDILADFCFQSGRCVFVCGGEEVYRQLLPLCSNLYLTRIKRETKGDSFFPPFEDQFEQIEVVRERKAFRIEHWRYKV